MSEEEPKLLKHFRPSNDELPELIAGKSSDRRSFSYEPEQRQAAYQPEPDTRFGQSTMNNHAARDLGPLVPRLVDGSLVMNYGMVVCRHNALDFITDAVYYLEIADIPGYPDVEDNALAVADGDKVWCELQIDARSLATAATVKKAADWPESTAHTLIGGDDQVGSEGIKNIRLCEIYLDGADLKVRIIHSGHIDHFPPAHIENSLIVDASDASDPLTEVGSLARVLKGWDLALGLWILRTIKTLKTSLVITENEDDIDISLMEGSEGDMMYHDGNDWVPLLSPTAPGPYVLMHDGVTPYWETTEECSS